MERKGGGSSHRRFVWSLEKARMPAVALRLRRLSNWHFALQKSTECAVRTYPINPQAHGNYALQWDFESALSRAAGWIVRSQSCA